MTMLQEKELAYLRNPCSAVTREFRAFCRDRGVSLEDGATARDRPHIRPFDQPAKCMTCDATFDVRECDVDVTSPSRGGSNDNAAEEETANTCPVCGDVGNVTDIPGCKECNCEPCCCEEQNEQTNWQSQDNTEPF